MASPNPCMPICHCRATIRPLTGCSIASARRIRVSGVREAARGWAARLAADSPDAAKVDCLFRQALDIAPQALAAYRADTSTKTSAMESANRELTSHIAVLERILEQYRMKPGSPGATSTSTRTIRPAMP